MAPNDRLGLSSDSEGLLARVRERFLSSGDFNGLHFQGTDVEPLRAAAIELLQAGLIEITTGEDYPNIHIRPWPSRRSVEDQNEDLLSLGPDDYGVCLYPTPAGMRGVRLPRRLDGRPFARAMARGKGTLELAYFEFDVLEQYRNDSRFMFGFGEFGASMSLSDEASLDPSAPERDHVFLNHIGFAYDLSRYDPEEPDSPILRRVAVFYSDLKTLTPEHQRRWETYQVPDTNLEPHPLWWNGQMGTWPDGVGPFTRIFMELENLNELAGFAFGRPLFRSTERPADLGWILRPSQREWDDFVCEMDKVLSENLRSKFFDAAFVLKTDEQGQHLGTLTRLELFMEMHGVDADQAKHAVSPLKEVRAERQAPSHRLRTNITDRTFIHRQIQLVQRVYSALVAIREWLATHPKCSEWKETYPDLKTYFL